MTCIRSFALPLCVGIASCGSSGSPPLESFVVPLPAPICADGGGTATVAPPELIRELSERWHEGWLASPAVVDLEGDGDAEVIVARAGRLLVYDDDGTLAFGRDTPGRTWSSPVVADLTASPGLEIAIAARAELRVYEADGDLAPGFPVSVRDELRGLAAGDIDGASGLELVVTTTSPLNANNQRDFVYAFHGDGTPVTGFPPNTSGAAGCDGACYVTGGYDQNVALGNVDGDSALEIFATQDNAYLSLHDGDGRAFDAASIFRNRTKFLGVRFLLDYAEAQQGYSDDEAHSLQAHFTNSAPTVVDLDGDGRRELVVLGSVQNTAQTDRFRGVVVFAINPDGTRPTDWVVPYHEPNYLAGLWDFDGTNIVGATNQLSVADLDPDRPGPDLVFAGFDGRIHAIDARGDDVFAYVYTRERNVLTAGVAIADLSADGVPEIVFATYSTRDGVSELIILDAGGHLLHAVPLPGRGSMAVPTLADVDGDGALDITVALKSQDDRAPHTLVYRVPGATAGCAPWPTGRGNLLRNGLPP